MTSRLVWAMRSTTSTPRFLHNAHSTGFVFMGSTATATWRAQDINARPGSSAHAGPEHVMSAPGRESANELAPAAFHTLTGQFMELRTQTRCSVGFRLNKGS
jgi:hypothetical protein